MEFILNLSFIPENRYVIISRIKVPTYSENYVAEVTNPFA